MKKLLIFLTVLIMASCQPAYSEVHNQNNHTCPVLVQELGLSEDQEYVMFKSYKFAQHRNLGYSLAAIGFFESSAGKNMENRRDPSGGVFHVLTQHVLNDFDLPPTQENIDFAIDILSHNFDYAANMALRELEWWLSRHNGSLFHAWRSYNGGYFWRQDRPHSVRLRSYEYATNVRDLVRLMQSECSHWENVSYRYDLSINDVKGEL